MSFFGGISQDIFAPILPLYLANVLGLDKAFIGLTEGLVNSGASIFKLLSGWLTDRFGRKKVFVFLGYLFSLIARPLLAVFSAGAAVLSLRFLDGIGKGLKSAPKDALIAESSIQETRGKSFGIARALDSLGSVVGPLILFSLLFWLKDHPFKYQIIISLTALPLFITLLILKFKIKESISKPSDHEINLKLSLPRNFYIFLTIILLFGLGNSSDLFLILRAQDVGVTLLTIPLIYALFNFVYASASIPLGGLSDRIGREKVIIIGWLAYALAYLGFAFAKNTWQIWLLFAFYGIYYATTEGVAKALVADLVNPGQRGRAYGLYNTALGLVALPAGLIAGLLWDKVSPTAPFFFGGIIAIISLILLTIFLFYTKKDASLNHI